MIEHLPKGQIPDPIDERDFQYGAVVTTPAVDWEKSFRLSSPPDTDQGQADCCVGESASKLHWHLKGKQFSVRSIFAYIALSYGAYIRDGVKRIVDAGQETIEEAPDPNPKTPANMRDKTGLKPELALDDKEYSYFSLNSLDMDFWADAIQKYKGIVFGVQGTNEGWQNGLVPDPPKAGDYDIAGKVWGHALEGSGFHTHTNSDGTKERCIIAPSSWCNWVKEHHIRERYFKSGAVNSAWVLIPNKTMQLIKVNGVVYLSAGVNNKVVTGIADGDVLAGLFGDEPITDLASLPAPETQTLAKGFVVHKK